jgi:hypothetical protein
MECLVGHIHLHQHVAGKKLAFGIDLAATTDLDDLFGRHDHVFKQMLELFLRNLLADIFRHLALEIAVCLNDVPALGH